jgi:ketosteroid isomerase-like protein
MRNFTTPRPVFSRPALVLLLGAGLLLGFPSRLRAEKPETAPAELKATIAAIETAANARDLARVMGFYSADFHNTDGLTRDSTGKALTRLWERYNDLQYTTTLLSWSRAGGKFEAETMTEIEGTGKVQDRAVRMRAFIRSRQRFQGNKMISQEILSERVELTTGKNPPSVVVKIPDQVKVGQEFDFDVIVRDPLGDDLLAGVAIDERVDIDRYLNTKALDLELLQAGGLFKRVKAPTDPENRWLSAVLIQGDGITVITQRVKVEK